MQLPACNTTKYKATSHLLQSLQPISSRRLHFRLEFLQQKRENFPEKQPHLIALYKASVRDRASAQLLEIKGCYCITHFRVLRLILKRGFPGCVRLKGSRFPPLRFILRNVRARP